MSAATGTGTGRGGDGLPGEGAEAGDVGSCGRRVNTGSWRVPAWILAGQALRPSTALHR